MHFPGNTHTPLPKKGLEFSRGGVGVISVKPKNLKKCMKLNWNFQRGGEGVPSVREVWTFSGTTQCDKVNI